MKTPRTNRFHLTRYQTTGYHVWPCLMFGHDRAIPSGRFGAITYLAAGWLRWQWEFHWHHPLPAQERPPRSKATFVLAGLFAFCVPLALLDGNWIAALFASTSAFWGWIAAQSEQDVDRLTALLTWDVDRMIQSVSKGGESHAQETKTETPR